MTTLRRNCNIYEFSNFRTKSKTLTIDFHLGEIKRHLRLSKFANNKRQFGQSIMRMKMHGKILWHIALLIEEEYNKGKFIDKNHGAKLINLINEKEKI
jgi:hypothetical protein